MKQTDKYMKLPRLWFFNKPKTLTQKKFSITYTPDKIFQGYAFGLFIGKNPNVGFNPATIPSTSFKPHQQNLRFYLQILNPFQHGLLVVQHDLLELYSYQT